MWEGTERIVIGAPPEKIWAIVSDIDRHRELAGSGEVMTIENVSGPLAEGTTWQSVNVIKGPGRFLAHEVCFEFVEGKVLGWKSAPPPMSKRKPEDSVPDIRWWYRLEPKGSGTEVAHSFRVVEPKVGATMMKAFYLLTRREKVIRAGMRKTLENLRAAATA